MNSIANGMHDPVESMSREGYLPASPQGPPPGPLLAGHLTRCCRREVLRPAGTGDWLLILTLQGRAFFRQPGNYLEVTAGDVLLAAPGSYMHYAPLLPKGWDCFWVHFNPPPAWLPALRWPRAGKGLFKLRLRNAPTRREAAAALRRCMAYAAREAGPFGQELAYTALGEAVFLIARERAADPRAPVLSDAVRRVTEHMEETPAARHTLASLARLAGYSPTRLTHRFKHETGESVIAYLLKLRLRRAAGLLQATGRTIKEIAFETGFASQFYFSRQFQRHYATSPSLYRVAVSRRPSRPKARGVSGSRWQT